RCCRLLKRESPRPHFPGSRGCLGGTLFAMPGTRRLRERCLHSANNAHAMTCAPEETPTMKTTTLMTTAAAVLLSASLAGAQAVKHDEKSEGAAKAPAAQQNAPAEKMAPAMKKETTGQTSQPSTAPKAAEDSKAAPKAAQDSKADKKETTGQAPKSDDSGKSQTQMNAPSGAASGKATPTEEKTKSN